jgi:hypothetical protein
VGVTPWKFESSRPHQHRRTTRGNHGQVGDDGQARERRRTSGATWFD